MVKKILNFNSNVLFTEVLKQMSREELAEEFLKISEGLSYDVDFITEDLDNYFLNHSHLLSI